MNDFGREGVFTAEAWTEIDDAVMHAVGEVRVAQKVFAATSLPGAAVVPDDTINIGAVGGITVPEGQTKPLLEISGEFPLSRSQVDNESTLKTGKAVARTVAKTIALLEDTLFFQGQAANVPPNFNVVNVASAANGLLGAAPHKIDVNRADPHYPDLIFEKVVEGISLLVQATQPGPYALFVEAGVFADANQLNGNAETPAERIGHLVTGGFFQTGAMLVPRRGAAGAPKGLLVSLAGEPTPIYIGQDTITEVTQSDTAGNVRFRVFERVQIVARDPQALVAFNFK